MVYLGNSCLKWPNSVDCVPGFDNRLIRSINFWIVFSDFLRGILGRRLVWWAWGAPHTFGGILRRSPRRIQFYRTFELFFHAFFELGPFLAFFLVTRLVTELTPVGLEKFLLPGIDSTPRCFNINTCLSQVVTKNFKQTLKTNPSKQLSEGTASLQIFVTETFIAGVNSPSEIRSAKPVSARLKNSFEKQSRPRTGRPVGPMSTSQTGSNFISSHLKFRV